MSAPMDEWSYEASSAMLTSGRWQALILKVPVGYIVNVGGPTDDASPPASVNWTTTTATMDEAKRVALAAMQRLQKAWP
jgi:hypothetical protein